MPKNISQLRAAQVATQKKFDPRVRAAAKGPKNSISDAVVTLAAALKVTGLLLKKGANDLTPIEEIAAADAETKDVCLECFDILKEIAQLGIDAVNGTDSAPAAPTSNRTAAPAGAPAAPPAARVVSSREFGRMADKDRRTFLASGGLIGTTCKRNGFKS